MRRVESTGLSPDARAAAFPVLAWITLSLITAIVGPFSTFETMTFAFRVLYWGGVIGSAVVLGECIRRVVARFDTQGPLQADLIGCGLMAPVFGTATTVFNAVALNHDSDFAGALGTNILVVLLVCIVIIMVRAYIRHYTGDGDVAAPEILPPEQPCEIPGFLRDVDPEIVRSMRWIEADDHYLRVHAPCGSARVLVRFRDALEELSDQPGIRVHRSHWVKLDAVTEVRADGRRHVAVLPCGSEVPVSRSYLPDLQSAGLLPGGEASARQ
jgi:hypothetical protein